MLNRLVGFPIHYYLHLLGCVIVIVGLMTSKSAMSIGSIWLIANLVLEGRFKTYWKNLKKEPVIALIALFFLLHFIGLLWTENIAEGIKDIRIKLPLLVLPLVLVSKPINRTNTFYMLALFTACAFLVSLINFFMYHFASHSDFRSITLFGSHIRLGLMIVFATFLSLYHFYHTKNTLRFLSLISFIWLTFYTLFSQVVSANVILILLLIFLLFYKISALKNQPLQWFYSLLVLLVLIGSSFFLISIVTPDVEPVDSTSLEEKTAKGNRYRHYPEHELKENGHHIYLYICDKELRKAWNKRSTLNYDSLNSEEESIKSTLVRYMASKGLRKDAEGFEQLSSSDIKNIEEGLSTVRALEPFYFKRLEDLKMEIYSFQKGTSRSGYSFLQRLEYWNAALHLINNDFWFGVGTGDVPLAMNHAYNEINSPILEKYRNKPHNQFLSVWVGLGVFGFVFFTLIWFYFLRKSFYKKNLICIVFGLIIILSFIPEDTIQTQQGVTFASFFLGLFLCSFLNDSKTSA